MPDSRRFIQLTHPGKEHGPARCGMVRCVSCCDTVLPTKVGLNGDKGSPHPHHTEGADPSAAQRRWHGQAEAEELGPVSD